MATAPKAVCCLGEYRRRVLLAHSHSEILQWLRDAFTRAEFDVILATDAKMAERCLESFSFDACVVEYALSDPANEAGQSAPGLCVVRQFRSSSPEIYRSAWVLMAKGEDEIEEFEDHRIETEEVLPIVNISPLNPQARATAGHESRWDAVVAELVDCIARRSPFFWDLNVTFEAPADETTRVFESVSQMAAAKPKLHGDRPATGREILGEALRLAMPREDGGSAQITRAEARLLPDQGYAGRVIIMSPIGAEGTPYGEQLVKVASAADGEREYINFERYVRNRKFSWNRDLQRRARTIRGDLSVLLFPYVKDLQRLTKRLREPGAEQSNCTFIRRLFTELTNAWYKHGERWTGEPLEMFRFLRADPLTGAAALTDYWKTSFAGQKLWPFEWMSHENLRQVSCDSVSDLVKLLKTDKRCADIRAITHGDLHSMNVLVTPQGDVISLADFSGVSARGSVLHDAAQFETPLVVDVTERTTALEEETAFLHALYGSPPAIMLPPLDLRDDHLRAGYAYVGEVRRAVGEVVAAYPTDEAAREQLMLGYGLALLSQFVRKWQYLKEGSQYTDDIRWRTLFASSLLAENLKRVL